MFPEKENPAVASNAGEHEVPATVEAGVFQHLDEVNSEFAEQYTREEEGRIREAFDKSSERLDSAQEIAHGVAKEHVGFEDDALTPKVTEGDAHGRYHPVHKEE